jgi:predicted nucleotidyltransferase
MGTLPKHGSGGEHLAEVLFGRTRQRVLGWLFGHPDEAFYLREIVRQTGGAPGAVQRELEALTRAGLISREARGRHVYFQANRASPVFTELQSIVSKTVGLVDVLREMLTPLGDRIRVAFVFGSAARNGLRRTSDIDVIIVGTASFSDVVAALTPAQARLGRDVNPTVYAPREFRQKLQAGHHFLTRVLEEPITFVVGESDELGRLGAKRVADQTPDERGRDSRSSRGGRARSQGQRG